MKQFIKISTVLIIIIAIIWFFLYAAKLTSSVNLLNIFSPEKITSIKNIKISGKEGDSKRWEIEAEEGWTGRERHSTVFENVSSCTIYENNYPIVKNMTARRIIANSENKNIEVFKYVDGKGWLSANIDFNRSNNIKDYSAVYADYIKFNPDTDKALIKDNILIIKDDLTIEAEEIYLNIKDSVAEIYGNSRYKKGKDLIKGNSATAYLDQDTIHISSIEVYQSNKTAFAGSGILNDKQRTLLLSYKVKAIIEKIEDAIKDGSAEKVKGAEIKKVLKEKTIVTADKMFLRFDDKNFTAKGNVVVIQKGKRAKSNFAKYNEENEEIEMTGNVFMEKKDQWIKTEKIIVSVKNEAFHAIGNVETEFIIKK